MNEVSVGELFIRLIFSLGVVIGVMAAAAWALKRVSNGGFSAARQGRPIRIEVLGRHSLSRRSSIAIVRTGTRGLVLGVTDQQVTLLAETTADELMIDEAPRTVSSIDDPAGSPVGAVEPTRRNITEALRDRTVRRS